MTFPIKKNHNTDLFIDRIGALLCHRVQIRNASGRGISE